MKDLSLHLLDLAQNSVVAGANLVRLEVDEQTSFDRLTIILSDDGCGMDEEFVKKVSSPFTTTRTTRKVGLGIPMFMANAEASGGSMTIKSEVGVGTTIEAWFGLSHIDRPPMGDLLETWLTLIIMNPNMDFVLLYRVGSQEFCFDTREVKEALGGDVPIDNSDVVAWMRENMSEGVGALCPTA